jgi:hypothetical protein
MEIVWEYTYKESLFITKISIFNLTNMCFILKVLYAYWVGLKPVDWLGAYADK